MNAPYVSQTAQVMRALYGGVGSPLMSTGVPRRPRRPPPAVIEAEVLSISPAGQIPVEQPLEETRPAGYQQRPPDNPPAGSSIPVGTWRSMNTEQRLAYINAGTEDRRRIENAVGQGVSQAFNVFADVIRREQDRAAQEGSETRANDFRQMLLRLQSQQGSGGGQIVVQPAYSTSSMDTQPNIFTRRYGGVPVWGWGLIVAGVGTGGYLLLRGKGKKRRRK